MAAIPYAQPVNIRISDLQRSDKEEYILSLLEEAIGSNPECLGLIVVDMRTHPTYASLREKLLLYASKLAALPDYELKKLERPDAKVYYIHKDVFSYLYLYLY